MVNVRARKSGLPMIAAMMGITRLLTSELMTAANARPMTNATASSMMLPLKRKSLNSFSMNGSFVAGTGRADATTSGGYPSTQPELLQGYGYRWETGGCMPAPGRA